MARLKKTISMHTKKHIIFFLMGLFLLSVVTESYSQKRSSRSSRSKRGDRSEKTEKIGFKDQLAYDIHIGNLGFSNGFYVSGKLGAGYKPIEKLTVGLGTKLQYRFYNELGNSDFDVFNYGIYGYTRYRIVEQFYLKGEYNYFSAQLDRDGLRDREKVSFPMLGGGYISGFGKWKYGFEVMFTVGGATSEPTGFQARDIYSFIEYTILFAYNL